MEVWFARDFISSPLVHTPTYCYTALHPAMFGDDGLERLNKTLRQQLSDRGEHARCALLTTDARLSVLEGEVRKQETALAEARRRADDERQEREQIEEKYTRTEGERNELKQVSLHGLQS